MRRRGARASIAALLVAALACCAAPAPPPPRAAIAEPPPRPRHDVGPVAPRPVTARALSVRLTHRSGALSVEIAAAAPPGELRAWTALPGFAADATRSVDSGPWLRVDVAPAIDASATSVRYRYRLAPRDAAARVDGAVVDARGFRTTGAHALAWPIAFEDKPVDATVAIDTDVGDVSVRGSSYGVGAHREVKTTGAALRRALFASGPGGRAEMHVPEGHDEALWLGYPAFDPRAVAAEVAGFRTALHEYFLGHEPKPATLILATDARPPGRFHVARATRGVIALISGRDAWDGPLRLAVATELVHAWIGDLVWLGPADGGADRVWFHDGIARAIARDELFRVGLLTPEEYLTEISAALSEVIASPRRATSNEALAKDIDAPRVRALLVARGALYGATVRARIRKATKGQRSLQSVARALYAAAASRRGPVEASRWLSEVAKLTSEAQARGDFTRAITEGAAEALPSDALGPCFEPVRTRFESRDLGFDEGRSRASGALVGVVAGGPAAKAGLRDGEVLLDVKLLSKSSTSVAVERGGARVEVAVTPLVRSAVGPGFRRRAGVKDDACR